MKESFKVFVATYKIKLEEWKDVIILKFYVGVLKGKANNVLVMLIGILVPTDHLFS